MKKITVYIFIFILSNISLFAQRMLPFYVTGSGVLTQISAGVNYLDIKINYSDQTGMTTGTNIDDKCVLMYFNTDESVGYELPVMSVVTPSETEPVIRVNVTGYPNINGTVNGQQGVVYRKNSAKHFAPYVSNLSNNLRQVLDEANNKDLEAALNAVSSITKYIGNGIPNFVPSEDEPKIAQGLSTPYPIYRYNGTQWVSLTISDNSNMDSLVTINTTQTVTGKKTFSDTIIAVNGLKSLSLIESKGIKSTGSASIPATEILGVQKTGVAVISSNTTIDGTYNSIIINTTSGNVSVTLPIATVNNLGWNYKVSKIGNNTAKLIRPSYSDITLYSTGLTITIKNNNSILWEIE